MKPSNPRVELNLAQMINTAQFKRPVKMPTPGLFPIKSLDPQLDIHSTTPHVAVNECQSYLHGFCEAGPNC